MTTGRTRVPVLYFAGSGRSGTTIINNILGQLDGVFAAGELRYLWQRGLVEDHRCGCGLPFSECPLWQSVMDRLGAAADLSDAHGIGPRLLRRLRIAHVPAMVARRAVGRPAVPPHRDDRIIGDLYRCVADATQADLVVDSSKLPPYGLLLTQLPGLDVRILHVVRDSRATAFSWRRHKATGDEREHHGEMPRQPIWKSSLLWLLWNALTQLLWRRHPDRYLRITYEQFADEPYQVMSRIAAWLGVDPGALPFETSDSVRLAPTHSVAGNPDRHSTGTKKIRQDGEWRIAMAPRDRRVVTALTAAGLRCFGYPLGTGARRAQPSDQ
ncbi:MAG TPA: sulfotransferase [Segeticoccus sp.]|uniref:sulfotransferase n=1 Tax=Segeticoccus sp. TaxID=2706531 RepID=UPI002D7EF843|nr:sulfotransferase [Segeticoccus sp.]HET8600734.1 sulfotransferase [Segeticoccus sp.]